MGSANRRRATLRLLRPHRPCWDATDVGSLKRPEGVTSVFVDVGVPGTGGSGHRACQGRSALGATGRHRPGPGVHSRHRQTGRPQGGLPSRRRRRARAGAGCPNRAGHDPRRHFRVQGRCRGSPGRWGSEDGFALGGASPGGHGSAAVQQRSLRHLHRPPRPQGTRPGRSLTFLACAELKDDVLPIVLRVLGFTTTFRRASAPGRFTPKDYDVVCLFQIANPQETLWQKLLAYVQEGGKLAIVPDGGKSVADSYLGPAANKLLPGRFQAPPKFSAQGILWEFSPANKSPLMAPFLTFQRERDDVDFVRPSGQPRVYRYWKSSRLPVPASSPATGTPTALPPCWNATSSRAGCCCSPANSTAAGRGSLRSRGAQRLDKLVRSGVDGRLLPVRGG